MLRGFSLLCAYCSFALVSAATLVRAAEPRTFSLNLVRETGAESCTSSQRLASRIERQLGPVFVTASEAELSIEARLRHDVHTREWQARVVVSDRDGSVLGERELRSTDSDCSALDHQLMLVIAMAIDPEAADRGLPDELLRALADGGDPEAELMQELDSAQSTPPREPPATVAPNEARVGPKAAGSNPGPAPHQRGSRDDRWALLLGASLWSGAGNLPRMASGLGVAFGVDPAGFWPIVLSGALWFGNAATLTEATAIGDSVVFYQGQLAVSVCPPIVVGSALTLSACGSFFLTTRWTDTSALEAGHDAGVTESGPAAGLSLDYALSPALLLQLGALLHVPLGRHHTFTYLDQGAAERELFEPAPVQLLAQAGIVLRLF